MTTQTHTPAPWTLSKPSGAYIESATGGIAALTYSAREADAHLIAAAPDLLAALEDMLADFDHPGLRGLVHTHWGPAKELAMRQAVASAKAAINKAKGN